MPLQVGIDQKTYYNSATDASPTWVEISEIGDVTVPDLGANAHVVNVRSTSWMLALPGRLKNASFDFNLAHNIGNTVFDALRGFALARTIKQFANANGAIATSGTEGIKAFAFFEDFPWNAPLDDVANHDCVARFAWQEESSALVPPAWLVIP